MVMNAEAKKKLELIRRVILWANIVKDAGGGRIRFVCERIQIEEGDYYNGK